MCGRSDARQANFEVVVFLLEIKKKWLRASSCCSGFLGGMQWWCLLDLLVHCMLLWLLAKWLFAKNKKM